MLEKKMIDALNVQINEELKSAYIYQAMSADFADKDRPGQTAWMAMQAKEEVGHAMKIYNYLLSHGAKVELQTIEAPQSSWSSEEEMFKVALKHEKFISGCIKKLVKLAKEIDDTPTEIFLQWFVLEQVEEESSVEEILAKYAQVGSTANGLYMLDKELGKRAQS